MEATQEQFLQTQLIHLNTIAGVIAQEIQFLQQSKKGTRMPLGFNPVNQMHHINSLLASLEELKTKELKTLFTKEQKTLTQLAAPRRV